MPDRFGSNESPYDALRAATLGSVSRADSNNDLLYLRLDATNDPVTGALDINTNSASALRVLNGSTLALVVDTATPQTTIYKDFLHLDPVSNFGLNRSIFSDGVGVLREWTIATGGVGDQRATISLIPKGAGLYGTGTSLELFVDDSTGRYLEMRAGTSGNKFLSRATAPATALPMEFAVGPTDTPETLLTLNRAATAATLTLSGQAAGLNYAQVFINAAAGGQSQIIWQAGGVDKWTWYLPTGSDEFRLYNYAAVADALIINAGNVGIGVSPSVRLHALINPDTTNSIDEVVRISRNSTGTAANGLGARQLFTLQSSTTADQSAAALDVSWATATHASRKARILGKLWDTAERQWLQVDTDGSSTDVLIDSLIYGSMYADDITQSVTIGSAGAYVKVPGSMTAGTCNGFTLASSRELTCTVAGTYLVNWGMSLSPSSNNEKVSGAAMVNTTEAHQTEGSAECINTGKPVHVSGSGFVTLAVNDVVALCVENEDAAHDITVYHANLTLVRVGV